MIILHASSTVPMEEVKKLLASDEAVAIRADCVQSEEEIELAYYLAKDALENKKNIAKKLKFEFLLWLSGKTDIKRAIMATEAKDSRDFLLIALQGEIEHEKLGIRKKAMKLKKKAEPLTIEQISLSRIR